MNGQTAQSNELAARSLVPRLLRLAVALSVANVLLLITVPLLVYFLAAKKIVAVGITETGRVIELVTLDKPYVNDSRVAGFAEECLRLSFAHDFENYRQSMTFAKSCYTTEGARVFEAAMQPQIKDLIDRNLVMSAALEVTVVERTFVRAGVVYWITQTPVTLQKRGSKDMNRPERFLARTEVRRVPLDENVRGIAVSSISLKPI